MIITSPALNVLFAVLCCLGIVVGIFAGFWHLTETHDVTAAYVAFAASVAMFIAALWFGSMAVR